MSGTSMSTPTTVSAEILPAGAGGNQIQGLGSQFPSGDSKQEEQSVRCEADASFRSRDVPAGRHLLDAEVTGFYFEAGIPLGLSQGSIQDLVVLMLPEGQPRLTATGIVGGIELPSLAAVRNDRGNHVQTKVITKNGTYTFAGPPPAATP